MFPVPTAARRSAWETAWLLLMPLAIWLLAAKAIAVGYTSARYFHGEPPAQLFGALRWLSHFAAFRAAALALVAWAAWRLFFPRRPVLGVLLFMALVLAFAGAMTVLKGEPSFAGFLAGQFASLADQSVLFLKCIWREAISVSVLVLVAGLLLHACPAAARKPLAWGIQLAGALLCLLVMADLMSELAIGQPLSAYVLLFSLSNVKDVVPLLRAEATPFRLALIGASIAVPALWAWHLRALPREIASPDAFGKPALRSWGLPAAAIGAAAALLPTFAIGMLPMERFTQGALVAFARSATTPESREASARVDADFDANGRPPWHSIGMTLHETDATRRKNIVVVMMESVRAVSTSVHTPQLQTTPFLAALAARSLVVEDMSAVVPRTASAWVAVLSGQYPLTNEGGARWNTENARQARLRALPGALSAQGYASAFFTPATLSMLGDRALVAALGFDTIVGSEDLGAAHEGSDAYSGLPDEAMVEPILAWTAAQVQHKRPFITAVMTNVGHHPYQPPPSWQRIAFDGVTDPVLADYLNCVRYIDDVVARLMAGYARLGVLDDTIFVFLGDHGQFFGEHGVRLAFNALYQEGLHVPALIYAPTQLQPGVIQGPRQQVDVMPTLLELLGLRLQGAALPGRSLLAQPDASREMFYSSSMESTILALRRGPRKYIYTFDRSPMEVYDLASDPREERPLQNVDKHEMSQATTRMLEWRAAAELSMFARSRTEADGRVSWARR